MVLRHNLLQSKLFENNCACLLPPPVPVAGLWLFSRSPVDPTNTAVMREAAQKLGYDLSVLKKVQQQGCTYPGSATSAADSSSNAGDSKTGSGSSGSSSNSSSASGQSG